MGIGGGVWAATGEPLAIPVAIATGVLIDSDHVLEFADWLIRGWKKYMVVFFHAWEYSVVLLAALVVWHPPLFVAAVLGHLGHMVGDQLANRAAPLAYFITYRISKGFSRRRLVLPPPPGLPVGDEPFWAHLEPWLWRLVHKRRQRSVRDRQDGEGNGADGSP